MTEKLAALAERVEPCPDCEGEGWQPIAVMGCCGGSDWECGASGCTGPVQDWAQEGCESCQGTGTAQRAKRSHNHDD